MASVDADCAHPRHGRISIMRTGCDLFSFNISAIDVLRPRGAAIEEASMFVRALESLLSESSVVGHVQQTFSRSLAQWLHHNQAHIGLTLIV